MTDARAPEAGWYPDPSGGSRQRWWTGMSWSEHTRQPGPPLAEIITPRAEMSAAAAGAVNSDDDAAADDDDADDAAAADDDDYVPLRRPRLGTGVPGKGRLRNILAYRSLNLGAASAILFVITVVCADLAWRVTPFGVTGWLAVALCLIGTGIAVLAILFGAVALFRVPTYRGLGPALTGLAFGMVFAFSIPLAGLALQLVLETFG